MRSMSSNRSHQSIMSGLYLPGREKYLVCASRHTFTFIKSKSFERVDDSHQSLRRDVVLNTRRKKIGLGAVRTFDEAHWILARTPQNSLISVSPAYNPLG